MPDVAAQWAGGHAYLLVGVEEEALHPSQASTFSMSCVATPHPVGEPEDRLRDGEGSIGLRDVQTGAS